MAGLTVRTVLDSRPVTAGRAARPPLRVNWTALLAGGAALLVLLPVVYLAVRFLEAGPAGAALLFAPATLATLLRTAVLALAVAGASILVGLPAAWLTARTDLPGRRVWSVALALPMVLPSYIAAYLWVAFLGPRGMLAQWLEGWAGIERLPAMYGFPGAFLILTLLCYPYVMIAVRAALSGLDPALEEAARGLGSPPLKVFWRVVLPQLRPASAAGGLLAALYVMRDFGVVSLLRYDTFTRVVYVQYTSAFDRTSASGLALILVGLTLLLVFAEGRTRSRARYHRPATGSARKPALVRLGAWRAPALAFAGGLAGLGLVLPVGVLLYWLARGWQAGERIAGLWPAAQNSLLAAGLAALATLAAALPVALVTARGNGRLARLVERAAYSGYALPGIVVALALVFLATNFALPLYQTLFLLVLAYVILFLPQAAGTVRGSLLQVHGSLEEAARGLGCSPRQVLLRVTLPLIRPGLLAAAGMTFLTAVKELPATLILSPIGFKTLAAGVWSAVSEAFFAQAAAPALLLVLLSAVPMALLTRMEDA